LYQVAERELRFYETASGHIPAREWLDEIETRDHKLYGILMNRLDRVSDGNFGDCGPVGEGTSELRIDVGPGYRIYFGIDGDLVILLLGGMKRTQIKDIKKSKEYWRDYNA
jgi:putative addiction module killer protein